MTKSYKVETRGRPKKDVVYRDVRKMQRLKGYEFIGQDGHKLKFKRKDDKA